MATQMYDKQGNSEIVENRKVQQYLGMGWTFSKPDKVEKPKSFKTKTVQKQEPAEATMLEAEATAEVIKPTNKEE